jgi:cytochrome o ubiquinol oxidase operon protein cyoD
MSADAKPQHFDDVLPHGDDIIHHGSFRDYLIGFVLSVILTAIPFWMVIDNVFRVPKTAAIVILIFAIVQILVHMVYFLHMSSKSEGGWTILALMFTAVLVVITLTGSMWVMEHLDSNMMPMSAEKVRAMP